MLNLNRPSLSTEFGAASMKLLRDATVPSIEWSLGDLESTIQRLAS